MRAAIYRRHGPARDVLELVDLPVPEPGPGEVRARIRVSAVNPTDWKSRLGRGSGPVEGFPFLVPNQDGAGAIDAVGPGVDEGRVGERVWIYFAAWKRQYGTAADYICLPEDQAVPLPDGASDDLGASLGIPAVTAHRCLFADGPVADRAILIAGGAGAVGHYAIELARAAGAHHVVNYRAGRPGDTVQAILGAAGGPVDRIVEVAPVANRELDEAVLAPNGVIATYAIDGELVAARRQMVGNAVWRFVLVYTMGETAIRQAVADVRAALADGALTALPAHRFALDAMVDAHDAVEQNTVGKVLVDL
ncbi:MAG: NADPH:quinone reductase [Acidimicrobiales bacterium]